MVAGPQLIETSEAEEEAVSWDGLLARLRRGRGFAAFVLVNLAIGVVAYFVLIANELTNPVDGLWQGSYYEGYPWVVSIGRWFWPVIGQVRLNMSPEPFTTVVSILIYVVGASIVSWWFGARDSVAGYVAVASCVVSTAVCSTLSYRYMSPTFAVSFVMAVVAVWAIRRPSPSSCVIATCLLTLSLASYQASIGCACVLVILWTVRLLGSGESEANALRFLLAAAVCVLAACVVYKLLWDVVLGVYHISASSYRGADGISVAKIIASLPQTVPHTYQTFADYFFGDSVKYDAYQSLLPHKVVLVAFAAASVACLVRACAQRGVRRIAIACVLLALIPPAANVAMVMAVDMGGAMVQMTVPMATVVPFALLSLAAKDDGAGERAVWEMPCRALSCCLAGALLVGSFLMVSVDQHVMLSGRQAVTTLMSGVVSDGEYSSLPAGDYVFVGNPCDNPRFSKDPLWDRANTYAQYGNLFFGDAEIPSSYYGLLRDSGMSVDLVWNTSAWVELKEDERVQSMPAYPQKGYAAEVDGVNVVKVAEY